MKLRTGTLGVILMAATAPWATFTVLMGVAVPVHLSLLVILGIVSRTVAGQKLYFGRPVIALAIYTGLISASILWSQTPSMFALWYNTLCWLTYFLAFFGVLNFLPDMKALRWFVYASAIGALITLPQLAPYEAEDLLTTSRFAVKGHNANFTAYVLAGAFFVIALSIRYLKHSLTAKLALLGVLAVIAYQLTLLDTRGAQLSVVLSGITIVWGKWVTRSLARFASGGAILMSIAFSLGLLTTFLVWVDSLSSRSTGDLSGRVIIWIDALKFIVQHPFFGIGPGSFLQLGAFELGAHNIFLIVMLDCGVIGLSVFMWFLFEVWRAILTVGKDGQRIFFAFLMHWLPMAISGHWETAPYSWAVIAFAITLARVLQRQRSSVVPRRAPIAVAAPAPAVDALTGPVVT